MDWSYLNMIGNKEQARGTFAPLGAMELPEIESKKVEFKAIGLEAIKNNIDEGNKKVDYTQIKNDVRAELGNYFYQETEAKPMIITVIQEV